MTKRNPVSAIQNIWFDAQQVDDTDLTLEQNFNDTIESGTLNNHVGNGVLLEALQQNVLFDSDLASSLGFLDGVIVTTQNQPTDNNLGNQLEIQLTNSIAASRKSVKVCIIGLDFQSNLQFETFYFKTNEIQVSHKHFTKILLILFNDFIGDPTLSLNLGGRIIIKEASPMTLSRDGIMVAQDVEPNLFFRDFFVDGFNSLGILLQTALPTYNIDTLGISTGELDNKSLLVNDVTTQVGQKFVATTNNIQKITLLLSVQNTNNPSDLVFGGDLVVSIYPLQSTTDCINDIAPSLPIDFAPSNIPIAQISVNYTSLFAAGIVLDTVPQPIDFIFSNSNAAAGTVLVPGNYYAIAIKRAGSANKCDILIAVGKDHVPNSRITTFTGTLWVDIPEQDLWFRIWTDSAKVSDGQGYDSGHGVVIPKTILDPTTQVTVDHSLDNIQFTGGDVFKAVLSAVTQESVPVPDQRTGNPVLSRKQFVPQVDLLNTIDLANLENASEPILLGAISDKNIKFFDSSNSTINSKLYSATLAHDELLIRIVDDPTDSVRFDTTVSSLASNLLNGDFVGAKIIPDSNFPNEYYRVASARLCNMIVGDVNGDGVITSEDFDLLNTYLNYNLNVGLPVSSIITTNTITTTFTNGYNTYTQPFANAFGLSFQLVDPVTNDVVASGTDGVIVANPADARLAQFTSSTVNFGVIVGLSSFKVIILTAGDANHGGFDVIGLDNNTDVLTIRKIVLSGDVLGQMLRADIDGDFVITFNDGYLLQSYIERMVLTNSPHSTFPGPSTNPYTKIGTTFNVIRFKLEKFIDRTDDYSTTIPNRSSAVHISPDIFLDDGYLAQHNFYASPLPLVIQKQLTWDESLIVTSTRSKSVPTVFTSLNGFSENPCTLEGISCNVYPVQLDFDPGRVDYYVPNNLIIGDGGELQRPDGNFYKVDFEVGTIVLEIPDGLFGTEKTINIMDDFISDYNGNGITRLGFPAMRFADCSFVSADALAKDQVRFSVSVQSFSPNNNGLSVDGYTGAIVDGKMGVSIDYSTGLLTLNFTNLFQDIVLQSLSTKVQINVFLKKGGFNNAPIFVDSVKVQNMLKLISVFSGAVDGGPSALVDLENDTSGILPIIHGGTGLNAVGAFGTVLTSNGSGVSYQFVNTTHVTYTPASPSKWAGTPPSDAQSALDRMAALLFTLNGSVPIP